MKTVVPDYYAQFRCVAGQCQHTCCEGWEIDVDQDALERYAQIDGQLGEKLRANLVLDDCPHFRLTENERCPFLNRQNLCELILNLGEEALCQICSDHPRFRNDHSDRTEIGLGLCCEAVAALILGRKEKTQLLEYDLDTQPEEQDGLEAAVLAVRGRAIAILQDRAIPFHKRLQRLLSEFEVKLPNRSNAQWAGFYMELERLDGSWDRQLEKLAALPQAEELPMLENLEIPFEQLGVYFLYRHLPPAQDETELKARLAFAVLSCQILYQLCWIQEKNGGCTQEDLQELARLYSSEIEYSEENTDAVLQLLWQANS